MKPLLSFKWQLCTGMNMEKMMWKQIQRREIPKERNSQFIRKSNYNSYNTQHEGKIPFYNFQNTKI